MLAWEANSLTELGRAAEAVRLLEQIRPDWEKLPDPYGRWSAFAQSLARAYVAVGRYRGAENLRKPVAATVKDTAAPVLMASLEYVWAEALAGQHRYAEALPHAEYTNKVCDSIPASFVLTPERQQNIARMRALFTDISAHQAASDQKNLQTRDFLSLKAAQ